MSSRAFAMWVALGLTAGLGTIARGGEARPAWLAPPVADGQPCPILRRSFVLTAEPVAAVVKIVGLGHFELTANGTRVGSSLINQPWSQYDRRIYWQEFDLTGCLRTGENVLGVMLGNSFWRVGAAVDPQRYVKAGVRPDFSAGRPYLLWLEASIETRDGARITVVSDGAWRWTEGPLIFSSIYAGEDFDARRIAPGWDAPGFDAGAWRPAAVVAPPAAELAPYLAPPLAAFEVFQPTEVKVRGPGECSYVFAQNCSALLRFTVEGAAGSTIRFKLGESMDSGGRVMFTYTMGTGQEIWYDYTLRGGGPESHQILFCYLGGQYVGVTGAMPPGEPGGQGLPVIRKLELVHVRAACDSVGAFTCANDLQQGAYRLVDWAIRSNLSYVVTDCPHREKIGWLEQAWHMARAISYRFDVRTLYEKIAVDIRDAQLPDGHIPTNCPNYLVGDPAHGFWNEAPEWGIAGVLVPWHLYEWYGDREALAASYESMRRYIDYLSARAVDGIVTSNLGDWCEFGHAASDDSSRWTPPEVSATAIWALGVRTMAQAAAVLDRPADAAAYGQQFERIRADFQRHFYDAAKKTVRNHRYCMGANAVALCAGLVPDEDRAQVLGKIVNELEWRRYQPTVGEVLQVFLVRALAEGGRGDILHRIFSREELGSYGYLVQRGLTTLPERWSFLPGAAGSLNHLMLGHLLEWHYAYVAGIRQQPGGVGWRRVLIAPQPGPLASAAASFASPAGRIEVDWRQEAREFRLRVTIPAGVAAEVVLPDSSRHAAPVGTSTLSCVRYVEP